MKTIIEVVDWIDERLDCSFKEHSCYHCCHCCERCLILKELRNKLMERTDK